MAMQNLMLLGRATKNCEVLESKTGSKYAKVGIAINDYSPKNKQEMASFYDVLILNKSAERADKINKGDYLLIEGRPEAEAYIDKEGNAKATIKVFANKWRVLK